MNDLTLTQQVRNLEGMLEDLRLWLEEVNARGNESVEQIESAITSLQNQITAVDNKIGANTNG